MGQSQQESEGESEGQSRSGERINRSGEEERTEETEREGSNLRRTVRTYGIGRNTAVGTESVNNGGTGEETADRGLVSYDPGPDAVRISRQYDLDEALAATGQDADSVRVRTRIAVPDDTDPETVADLAAETLASYSFELVRESADERTLVSVDWFDPEPTGTVRDAVLNAVEDHGETVANMLRADE